jgi:hypothetical protein
VSVLFIVERDIFRGCESKIRLVSFITEKLGFVSYCRCQMRCLGLEESVKADIGASEWKYRKRSLPMLIEGKAPRILDSKVWMIPVGRR